MYCQACGAKNTEDARFCNMCGTSIAAAGSPGGPIAAPTQVGLGVPAVQGDPQGVNVPLAHAATVQGPLVGRPPERAEQAASGAPTAAATAPAKHALGPDTAELQGPTGYLPSAMNNTMSVSLEAIGVRSSRRTWAVIILASCGLVALGAIGMRCSTGETPVATGGADPDDPFIIGTPVPEGEATPGVDFVTGTNDTNPPPGVAGGQATGGGAAGGGSARPSGGATATGGGTRGATGSGAAGRSGGGGGAGSGSGSAGSSGGGSAGAGSGSTGGGAVGSGSGSAGSSGGSTTGSGSTGGGAGGSGSGSAGSGSAGSGSTGSGSTGSGSTGSGSTGSGSTGAGSTDPGEGPGGGGETPPAAGGEDAPAERDIEMDMYAGRVRFLISRYYAARAATCFDRARRADPSLSGTVVMGMTIGGDGAVSSARVVRNSTGDANLGTCLQNEVRQWRLSPPPGGESVTMNLPFSR